ncbi:uncharacterized protein LOC110925224 [Helianthus annuus]|uniref:uncharacterized protein LOC110925224 n=1 Tax=Helianthus annuus TaxID=4232 RepID=UPI000B8FCD21|nr:uncharacterized protein LOC110925224 [Helianthus annuus]
MVDQNFILVKGELFGENTELVVVNIYAPNIGTERRRVWDKLLAIRNSIQGLWLIIGDFNEVRVPEDRWNSNFDGNNALHFNNFIGTAGLLEYPMTGRKYTFMSGDGKKLSKIDRALVSDDFMYKWPNASLRALERTISDHSTLILATGRTDYGPILFRFFNSWLETPGLVEAVKKGLDHQVEENFKDLVLGSKLKNIKEEIKKWRRENKEAEEKAYMEATERLKKLDADAEERELEEKEVETWGECKSKIREWFRRKAKDYK